MRLVFEGVRLIDGAGTLPGGPVDLVVRGDRVAAILGPDAASGARGPHDEAETVIAGAGRTALPGLIDAHAHYTFDPTEGSLQAIAGRSDTLILERAADHASRALQAGITTARGAGSIRGLEFALRDSIAAGTIPGPRLIAAGTAIGSIDGHGAAFGVGAAGPAALIRETEAVLAAGADVIKVVASEAAMLTTTGHAPGRMVFGRPELDIDELRAIVDTAHAAGRLVMAHAQDSESVIRCVQAGVDSVEHAWLAGLQAIEAVATAGATIVPTLAVIDVNRTLQGLTPEQRERQDHLEATHAAACRLAIELGVPLVAGTDTGEVGVTADLIWREIALLAGHGLSALDAIAAATSGAARLLGIDDEVGMLVPGLRADIVIVAGDPLVDLSLLAAPQLVVQSGRLVFEG